MAVGVVELLRGQGDKAFRQASFGIVGVALALIHPARGGVPLVVNAEGDTPTAHAVG